MPRTERIILWAVIGLLALASLGQLTGHAPATAVAVDGDTALGPATALTLDAAKEDGTALTLRNEDDRLAWGSHPQQRLWSIGAVHLGPILTQLLESETILEEKQELTDELRGIDAEFQERLMEIQQEMDGVDAEDAEAQEILQRGQMLYQEYQQFQQAATLRRQQMGATHLEMAYREITAAVNVVADRLEIDLVIRFIPPDDEFVLTNEAAAVDQIRLRSLLRYPEACDITSDVLEELNLEDN